MGTSRFLALVVALSGLLAGAGAEQFLSLKMGPAWPREIYVNTPTGQNRTAWEAELVAGRLFQDIVGFGASVNFLWHRTEMSHDSLTPAGSQIKVIDSEDRRFMFPLMVCLQIDPLPGLRLRPLLQGQLGFNMLVYSTRAYDAQGNASADPDNGFYVGPAGKLALDAVLSLVEQFGLFAGFQYEFSTVHQRRESNLQKEIPLYGPGIRMGIRMSL